MRGILIVRSLGRLQTSQQGSGRRDAARPRQGTETALVAIFEFDDVAAHLLEPEESLDSEQTGVDLDVGYSPPESPLELRSWG
jgi:hypothetical protein